MKQAFEMRALGIAVIVVIATAFFGALAYTLYNGGKSGNELVLKTIVEPGERIVPGMGVVVDNMAAGRVRDVANEYGTIIATLAIENQVARQVLRIGTIRKANDEYVLLSTKDVEPGASLLNAGDIVRFGGSTFDFALPSLDKGTRRIAVIGIALLFIIMVVWKICRSLLPLGLSLTLALLVGWIANPFVIPYVDKYMPQVIRAVETTTTDASAGGLAGLQGKVTQMLSVRPNSNVIAFLLTTMVSLPFCAILISMVGSTARRGISCAMVGGCLLASLAAPTPIMAAEVSYSRKHLQQEQTDARKSIDAAASLCEHADRLVSASLVREASEKLTEALFTLDVADLRLAGYDDRIQALKGAVLSYSRSEEQAKLRGGFKVVNERMRGVRDTASDIQKRATELNAKEANIIQVYLVLADTYRRRIREGLTEWTVVLNETRQLSGFPLGLIRSGVVNVDNVARCRIGDDESVVLPNGVSVMPDGSLKLTETQVKLSNLEVEAEKLRRELDDVRKQQTQVVSRVQTPIIKLREVDKPKKVSPPPGPVQKHPVVGQELVEPVPVAQSISTNPPLTVAVLAVTPISVTAPKEPEVREETPANVEILDPPLPSAMKLAAPVTESPVAEQKAVETNQASAEISVPKPNILKPKPAASVARTINRTTDPEDLEKVLIPIILGVSALIFAIIWLVYLVNRVGRAHEVTISAQHKDGAFAEHKLVSNRGEQIILGDGEPRIEPTGLNQPIPAMISINASGKAVIQPGTATVLLNGKAITGKTTINPGSSIQIKRDDQDEPDPETYTLRIVDPVASVKLQDGDEGELATITQEK